MTSPMYGFEDVKDIKIIGKETKNYAKNNNNEPLIYSYGILG